MVQKEKLGATFALINAAMWGTYVVLINHHSQTLPPITFAALVTLFGALTVLIFMSVRNHFSDLLNLRAWPSMLLVTLFVVIIPHALFFLGASMTSGINTAMLLLFEIVFTLLFTPLFGEKTTWLKLMSGGSVFIGAFLLLYNGALTFNVGDILILLSTFTHPFGNFFAKKAFNVVAPMTVLLVRFSVGGAVLFLLSRFIEPTVQAGALLADNWPIIVVAGIILLGLTKVIWYEGLRRLDISKAISLGSTFPFFSVVILSVFFHEPISTTHWIGIGIIMIGVIFSIERPSTKPRFTSYGHA